MKIVNSSTEQTDNKDVIRVGLAIDSKVYYAALVDTKTHKCYVEEVGLSGMKTGYQGVYRKIDDEECWRRVYAFFNAAGVFDRFLKGRNWYWDRKNGRDNIPQGLLGKVK